MKWLLIAVVLFAGLFLVVSAAWDPQPLYAGESPDRQYQLVAAPTFGGWLSEQFSTKGPLGGCMHASRVKLLQEGRSLKSEDIDDACAIEDSIQWSDTEVDFSAAQSGTLKDFRWEFPR